MISNNYTRFFTQLEQNNHKDWFQANKAHYENAKAEFLQLADHVLEGLTRLDPDILPDSKAALFRINRDVRFSKDKTPYNLMMKASFTPGGRRSEQPGYYLAVSSKHIHIGGGLYDLKTPVLKEVRQYIYEHHQEFKDIVQDKSFIQYFGMVKGERAKRIDAKYQELLLSLPEIANKQFYVMTQYDLNSDSLQRPLDKAVVAHYKAAYPLIKFLKNAML